MAGLQELSRLECGAVCTVWNPYHGKYLSFTDEYYRAVSQLAKSGSQDTPYSPVYVKAKDCPGGTRQSGSFALILNANFDTGYILPYAIGASVSINQALLAAALNNLSLFTDSLTQHYLLRRKCQVAREKLGDQEDVRRTLKVSHALKETDLVMGLLAEIISNKEWGKVSIADIVRFRKEHERDLKAFRTFMLEVRHSLPSPSDEDYVERMLAQIDRIRHEIEELRTEMTKIHKQLFRDVAKAAVSVGVGLAVMPVSMTAGAVLAVLASKAPLDAVWEAWKKKSELKLSDLSFLVVAKDTFQYSLRGSEEELPWERYGLP